MKQGKPKYRRHNLLLRNVLKSKKTRFRLYFCICVLLIVIGLSVFTILQVNRAANGDLLIRNYLIIFSSVILALFIICFSLTAIDFNYQINSKVLNCSNRLLKSYDIVYLVDPKSDTFKILKNNKNSVKKKTNKLFFLNEINKYIDNHVYFKDIYSVKEELDYVVINKKLDTKASYSIYYREFDGNRIIWCQMSFSKYSPDLLMISETKKDIALLEWKHLALSEKDYDALFMINLDSNTIKTVSSSPLYKKAGRPGAVQPFDQAVKEFAERNDGEARQLFENLSNSEYLKQELLTDDKRIYYFKTPEHGGASWFSVIFYVLFRNGDGTPAALSMAFSKLDSFGNDKQNLQLQLKDALSLAKSAIEAKTIFINSMSHKIRPSMNAITGYVNLATNHMDNMDLVGEYLNKITQSSGYLLSLINDIIELSRIESGKIALEEKPEDLREIVHGLNKIIQPTIVQKKINFDCNVDIINKNIICDKVRLKQALISILSNAVKYTKEEGSIVFSVKQLDSVNKTADKYEFRVKDNGIGISKDFLAKIFEPFSKEASNEKAHYQNSGLGLAITKNIVDMMNGTISIESVPNKGTEVVITLPLEYSDRSVVEQVNESIQYTKEDYVGLRILLAEDNPINREIQTDLLSEYGFVIKCAEDGNQVVEIMKNAKPGDFDIILMDIQMPNMDGYEATRIIRSLDSPVSSIPIFALTANTNKSDRFKSLEAGMNEHLAKPIQIENLFEKISKYIKTKKS